MTKFSLHQKQVFKAKETRPCTHKPLYPSLVDVRLTEDKGLKSGSHSRTMPSFPPEQNPSAVASRV